MVAGVSRGVSCVLSPSVSLSLLLLLKGGLCVVVSADRDIAREGFRDTQERTTVTRANERPTAAGIPVALELVISSRQTFAEPFSHARCLAVYNSSDYGQPSNVAKCLPFHPSPRPPDQQIAKRHRRRTWPTCYILCHTCALPPKR